MDKNYNNKCTIPSIDNISNSRKSKFLKNNMPIGFIDTLFKVRDEKLRNEDSSFENDVFIGIKNSYDRNYEKLISAIKNLPPQFQNTREAIFDALDEYLLMQSLIVSYENEVFYKSGFNDGSRATKENLTSNINKLTK